MNLLRSVLLLGIFAMFHGCATQAPSLTREQINAVLCAPDRAETDKANDTRRKASELLQFIDPRPGMQALDLGASGGYTSQLMARAVAATGRIYAQNHETFMKNFVKDHFAQRLQAYPGR
jgi:predicted methyltransferase